MKNRKTSAYSHSIKNTICNVKYMILLIVREKDGKQYLCRKMLQSVLDSLLPIICAVIPGLIINEFNGRKRLITIITYVLVLLITPPVQQVLTSVMSIASKKDIDQITMCANIRVFHHSIDMDYENYEKPEYNVLRDRVHETMRNLGSNTDHIIGMFSSLISLIAIASIISALNFWFIFIICIIVFVNSLITKRIDAKKFVYDKERSKWNNYNWVYRNSLVYNWNMKDVRLFNMNKLLIDSWAKITEKENLAHQKSCNLNHISSGVSSVFNFIQQLLIYAFVIWKVFAGQMEIGTMTILLSGTAIFSSSLGTLAKNYLRISEESMYIDEVKQFFALPHKQMITGHKTPVFDNDSIIEFCNVSFKYPGSEIYALKNLNLTFHGSERLCIVGNNGAGKTTFIKLLTRLYSPTEGEILLNGVNIYEYDLLKYQNLFAPVFQDGGAFNFTIGENIVLTSEWNDEKVQKIVRESGLKELIEKQPKKYDTQIGKWLDDSGIDLSGGEEQRFKIARAIYHGGDIYLLDEPTSALDPVTEYNIYTQFDKMTSGKSAILITHRLSAVHLSDKVAVFKDGSVAEYGTHDELYKKNGTYTEMFDKQSKFYRN
ncbi:MAG: ABC transporter ATP-binding protein/permease [Clostridia bacterium]|nr:ABC transporter ATP-binding protein/permease [Clostridia bacterium]